MLLMLVYAAFLVLIAGVAVAIALVVGAHFSSAILSTTVAHDRALVGLWADANLAADEINGPITPERRAELEANLVALADRAGIAHVELRDVHGSVLLANRPSDVLAEPADSSGQAAAVAGAVTAALITDTGPLTGVGGMNGPAVAEILPLIESGGRVDAVVSVWRDARPALDQFVAMRNDVLIVLSAGAVVLGLVLLFVFRAANRRLLRQNAALIESTRRDPLTGLLNHGAAVAGLAERFETARRAGAPLSVALVDVDNFRLLNDTHGHAAGDSVLLEVSRLIGAVAGSGCLTGRYGPDEFIVVGPPVATEVVEQVVEQLRSGLREVAMRFGDSEALPVTVSCGLAAFPGSGEGVTDLLGAAAGAVRDARASGGDSVQHADSVANPLPMNSTFSALQGLVFAVDNKDRYTKRHSEDVARYAVFLGRQMGLDERKLEHLRVAGLLHDVGKVGVPDVVLRKPAALNDEERKIVEQHVALGDLIVRDLPDLDIVRAGVRFHHERWDGNGYLDHLSGDAIPYIARILAVCDSYSAMTTTRPYRKAMSVSEALKRLGDAAGTQLDAQVVTAFVQAMDLVGDAPRPEDESMRVRLWQPSPA
jgi:diguanylate cyclase (GGDEF)-like protein